MIIRMDILSIIHTYSEIFFSTIVKKKQIIFTIFNRCSKELNIFRQDSSNRSRDNLKSDKAYFITMTVVGWVDVFTRKNHRDAIIESLKYSLRGCFAVPKRKRFDHFRLCHNE